MSQTLEALVVELRADIKGLQTSLQTAASDVSRFSNKASSDVDGFQAAIIRARTAIISLGLAWKAFEIGKGIVDAGVQLEAMRSRMLAATGDANVAADALAYIAAEADRLGIDIQSASNGFAGFSASALRAGLTLQQTKDIFTGVTEAAVSLRLPTEQVNLVFKALEQMAGKGVVSMEELRGQLGDALPGAFEIAAKAMGKTAAEFSKRVADGQVISADFLPRFGEAVRREMGGAVEEASQGAQAAFNRLGNAFFKMQTQIASSGLLDVVVESVNSLTAAISDPELASGLGTLISGMAKIAEFALKAASAIGSVVAAANRMIEAVGNSAFGALFGSAGTQAIQQARQQTEKAAAAAQTQVKAPAVSGSYTLGTVAPIGVSENEKKAREKAAKQQEQMRDRLRGQVDSMAYGFADPEEQSALDIEKQQKVLEEALEAKAITEQEYRDLSLEAEIAYQDELTRIREDATQKEIEMRERAGQLEVSMRENVLNSTMALLQVFAGKNKAIAMAMLVFDKARAIAQATIETHVAAAAALKYDPTGATSARVTAMGYANVALIAATGIAQLATMGSGGGNSGSGSSYGGASGSGYTSSSGNGFESSGQNKSVFITLNGDDATYYSKNNIRKLLESINDALGDGSNLKIAVGA